MPGGYSRMKKLALLIAFLILSTVSVFAENIAQNPVVELQTSMGKITIELYPDKAPITVENFLGYVKDGFYEGTIFHRVIDNFMIQGGGFTKEMRQKPTKSPIKNEAANGLRNQKGTVAMARTRIVDSAGSQFFINVSDNAFLDHRNDTPDGFGYCVFGRVTKGMEVVEAIKAVKTGMVDYYQNVPTTPVIIEKVELISAQKVKK